MYKQCVAILSIIFFMIVLSAETRAEIGIKPDPNDVCPSPTCNAITSDLTKLLDPNTLSNLKSSLGSTNFSSLTSNIGAGTLSNLTNSFGVNKISELTNGLGVDKLSSLANNPNGSNFLNIAGNLNQGSLSGLSLGNIMPSGLSSLNLSHLDSSALSNLNVGSLGLNSNTLSGLGLSSGNPLSSLSSGVLSQIPLSSTSSSFLNNTGLTNLNANGLSQLNLQNMNIPLSSFNPSVLSNLSSSPLSSLTNSLGSSGLGALTQSAQSGINLNSLTQQAQNSLNIGNLTQSAQQSLNLGNLPQSTSISSLLQQQPSLNNLNVGSLTQSAQQSLDINSLTQSAQQSLNINSLTSTAQQAMNLGNINPSQLANTATSALTSAATQQLSKALGSTFTDLEAIAGVDQRDNRYMKEDASNLGAMLPIDNTQIDYSQAPYTPATSVAKGLQGAMPKTAMPNKNTPAISLVANYPWLYKNIDASAQYKLYNLTSGNIEQEAILSPVAIDPTATDGQEINYTDDDAPATNNVAAIDFTDINKTKCQALKDNFGGAADVDNLQVWARLQYDSCANQYIIPYGKQPNFVFDQSYREHKYTWNETVCQPLSLSPVDCVRDIKGKCKTDAGESDRKMYDYRAWGYLELAWNSVLGSAGYAPNGGVSSGDSGLQPVATNDGSSGIGGLNIAGGDGYGSPFPTSKFGGSNYNNVTDKYTGNLTTINQLAAQPFERIFDPTHPFSPRWDWNGTDRDFSQGTGTITADNAAALGLPTLPFQTGNGYDLAPGLPCIVRCTAVPVDILSFRSDEFTACMSCRIQANRNCFWNEVSAMEVPIFIIVIPIGIIWLHRGFWGKSNPVGSYYFTLRNQNPNDSTIGWDPWSILINTPLACRSYYDKQGKWPLCSTKYDHPKDNVPSKCNDCVNKSGDKNKNGGVKKCCDDLAQALAGINTLKIRNTKENPALEPVPEGYRFADYFMGPAMTDGLGSILGGAISAANGASNGGGLQGAKQGALQSAGGILSGQASSKQVVHMPYMRWWDTGKAAGGSTDATRNYNPDCDQGSYDVIVGVGTDGDEGNNKGAKYCRYGGNGSATSYKNNQIIPTGKNTYALTSVDALTSWSELKQYQMNAAKDYGLNCLPQYEKTHKQFSGEDGVLKSLSSTISIPVTKDGGKTFNMTPVNYPLAWRGYISDPDLADQFPSFGSVSGFGSGTGYNGKQSTNPQPYSGKGHYVGLDNAKKGDIIYLSHDDVAPNTGLNIMPFIGVVTSTEKNGLCTDHVQIIVQNNGKFPDACGDTDRLKTPEIRTIYKETLPGDVYESMYPNGTSIGPDSCNNTYVVGGNIVPSALKFNNRGSCADPRNIVCTGICENVGSDNVCKDGLTLWNAIRVYRPRDDER